MSAPVPFLSAYQRIATEEAYAPPEMIRLYVELLQRGPTGDPGFDSLWGFYAGNQSPRPKAVLERLQDLGERRIADMDATGISKQILSITSPGVQILDTETARSLSELANDQMAEAVRKYPQRYAALAACAPQDPQHAAKEIERAVNKLGFKGALINSHTHDEYLNDSKFWAIFEACEALDVPFYLHPNTPSRGLIQPLLERGLDGAIFGFGVETAMHALTMITSGVFDRFPKLKLVLGHLGEALPYWMYRLDYMHNVGISSNRYACLKPLKKPVSGYLRDNVYVTTSGMPAAAPIRYCQEVLGFDHVMYAMDYPYQFVADEVRMQDAMPLTEAQLRQFFQTNAEQVFKL